MSCRRYTFSHVTIGFLGFVMHALFAVSTAFAAEFAAWTTLIYMAGDNNLSLAAVTDIMEMMEVGSTEEVNVLVQVEFSERYTPEIGANVTHRARILKDSYQYFSLGENVDMASPEALSAFIQWGVNQYPAERYALILWDHGLGWLGGRGAGGWSRGVLQDETSGSFMSLEELAEAFARGGQVFDVIGFDACLMGMWEVAGEIYPWSRFVVFSEGVVPSDGDPYDLVLGRLVADPAMTGQDLARVLVDEFVAYYNYPPNDRASVTKSAVITEELPQLTAHTWQSLPQP